MAIHSDTRYRRDIKRKYDFYFLPFEVVFVIVVDGTGVLFTDDDAKAVKLEGKKGEN